MNEPDFYQRADGLWDWRVLNVQNGSVVGNSGGQGFRDEHDARRGFSSFIAGLEWIKTEAPEAGAEGDGANET